MPTHKSNDYKLTAVQYYLVEDKTQEEVCKIFKCCSRSLMCWVNQYRKDLRVLTNDQKNMFQRIKQEK
jgi:transposase-like protein